MSLDKFGITMLNASTSNVSKSREWYAKWDTGPVRNFTFGSAGYYDPELIFRGTGQYTIYGASNSNVGLMRVTGSCPRIYVRNSAIESSTLGSNVKVWENVEVTYYANTTNPGSNVSYAGIQAEVRTNHYPDSDLCTTRGYGSKINFDGRAQFEKECCHDKGNKQVATVYPFPNKGRMPINKWIGHKFIARSCNGGSNCKLETWIDMTDGLNGGTWSNITNFIDTPGWSSDTPSCCSNHTGKVLGSNYSVYLRTDGLGEQFYKKWSIREIDPLP